MRLAQVGLGSGVGAVWYSALCRPTSGQVRVQLFSSPRSAIQLPLPV